MASDWSREEVEATVANYLTMLAAELRGEPYSKAEHRRRLVRQLSDRSEGAVERKHMNVSAVLMALGHPFIDGYKPYRNYQQLLFEVVEVHLSANAELSAIVESELAAELPSPLVSDPLAIWDSAPIAASTGIVSEPLAAYTGTAHTGLDYLSRDARNKALGTAGEELVLRVESARLLAAGQRTLSNRVEHVAQTEGDGLGYDVLSFETDGRERLIEVKTTSFGKRTPFFVSPNEVQCSVARKEMFHLYRLYNFRRAPRLYSVSGALDASFRLEATQYAAHV